MSRLQWAVLIIAIGAGTAFALWLGYEQWNWYFGWPSLTFASGVTEKG